MEIVYQTEVSMGKDGARDSVRSVANVVTAIFQVVAIPAGALFFGTEVGRVSTENDTLVVPADYAFVIWSPIFLLCLAYAVYQALPAHRENPLLRRVGPFTAGAFTLNGLWEILFPARQFLLAQVVIVGIFACAAVAYFRLVLVARERSLGAKERWLVALPIGLLFGWITAATLVSFATTFVALGLLEGGIGEAVLGAALLLTGGLVASVVLLAEEAAPLQGYLAYTVAVLWALAGVVVNQYDESVLTTVAALVAAVPVTLVVVSKLFGDRTRRRKKRVLSPNV
jgi:hypothetical protein